MYTDALVRFRAFSVVLLAVVLMMLGPLARAEDDDLEILWGPERFTRNNGAPVTETRAVSPAGYLGPFVLHLQNGDENGRNRVSSAWIHLNGVQILGPSGFNQQVESHEIEISLSEGTSELSVKLAGKPGGESTIWISGQKIVPLVILATVSPEPNENGWHNSQVEITFECSGGTGGVVSCPEPVTLDTEGPGQTVIGTAVDAAGITAEATVTVNIDWSSPMIEISYPSEGQIVQTSPLQIEGNVSDANSGVMEVRCNGAACDVSPPLFSCETTIAEGINTVTIEATDFAGNSGAKSVSVVLQSSALPPDPTEVAPPLDPTVVTTMHAATEFLYTGENPIQTGVEPETIDPRRVAVLRGRVFWRSDGSPASGIEVSIVGHPEFGWTLTRQDGAFDLAVNGGGQLKVLYGIQGRWLAFRKVEVPWQDYVQVPEVFLVELDPEPTTIDFRESAPAQVARGQVESDEDGVRQATLIFPEGGNCAEVLMGDGSVVTDFAELNVRVTEATVGPNGPSAMPLELPPTSAYTYAVNLTADEALAVGAVDISFCKPVAFYVENFLGFPVGLPVPVGVISGRYVDQGCDGDVQRNEWVPENDGRVIAVVGESGGLAEIDLDGDGLADDEAEMLSLGITEAERARLAELYEPGVTLWRAQLEHFSWVDLNFPIVDTGQLPNPPKPTLESDGSGKRECDPPNVLCQSQVVSNRLPISGTPFSLIYRSDRTVGRLDASTLRVPLSGEELHSDLIRIEVEISIAGRVFQQVFPPEPNLSTSFFWDGEDAYGRSLNGPQPVSVNVAYIYPALYGVPADEARSFGLSCTGAAAPYPGFEACVIPATLNSSARSERALSVIWNGVMGASEGPNSQFGGWALDRHHVYDQNSNSLYRGEGPTIRGREFFSTVLSTVLPWATSVTTAPDGSLYTVSPMGILLRMDPDGVVTEEKVYSACGSDPVPLVSLFAGEWPGNFTSGPDGSIYFTANQSLVGKISPDRVVSIIGGKADEMGFSGDGGPATEATFWWPDELAVAEDGSVYVADYRNHRVRRIGPDGTVQTIAGTGASTTCASRDGDLATGVEIPSPRGIAFAPDGSLIVVSSGCAQIRRVNVDGTMDTIASYASPYLGIGGDGGSAINTQLGRPEDVAVARDGSIIFSVQARNSPSAESRGFIRKIDSRGILSTLAGSPVANLFIEGASPLTSKLSQIVDLTVGPDDAIFFSEYNYPWNILRRLAPEPPEISAGVFRVVSQDGGEVFEFNSMGQHTRTFNALTGQPLFEFAYGADGLLMSIIDGDGNVTSIERESDGSPKAIISPFGHRTQLALNSNGFLSAVTNPAGETTTFEYSAGGLMASEMDPLGNTSRFVYDELGRVLSATDALGATQLLERAELEYGFEVTKTSALGRQTKYRVELLPSGAGRFVNTLASGTEIEIDVNTDRTEVVRKPDGTVYRISRGPDPRFGMQAPLISEASITTPSGLTYELRRGRTAALADERDVLSLESMIADFEVGDRKYSLSFDATNGEFVSTSPEGRVKRTKIDPLGRVIERSTGDLDPIVFDHDGYGRLVSASQGSSLESREVVYSYGSDGRLSSLTNPLGNVVLFERDAVGRTTKQTLSDGREIQYEWSPTGRLRAVKPPGRPAHRLEYSPTNLLSTYEPPSLGVGDQTTVATYNLDGQISSLIRPGRVSIDYSYDESGRLAGKMGESGMTAFQYHPETGQLSRVTSPNGQRVEMEYDGFLLTSTRWQGEISGQVSRLYDNDFRVRERSINGSFDTYFEYDADGFLTQAGGMTIERHPSTGWVTSTTLGAVSDRRVHNVFGEIVDYRVWSNGSEVIGISYVRDKVGRIMQKTESVDGDESVLYEYEYDTSGRLTRVLRDHSETAAYTYDLNSNRLTHASLGGVIEGSYNVQDRLTEYGEKVFGYAASGEVNAISNGDETTQLVYDEFGNLRTVALPDGPQIDYVIDGFNRRIGKRVNGYLSDGYLYKDNLKVIAQLDSDNNVLSRFVYATRRACPDIMMTSTATFRIISDHVGSPRLVVDTDSGEVVQRIDYDEFGNVLSDTSPGFQPFGFAGGLQDQHTHLVRFGARDYDPETGRWTAADPILLAAPSTNLYIYAHNDPVNYVDADGRGEIFESGENSERTEGDEEGEYQEVGETPTTHESPNPDIPTVPVQYVEICESGKCSVVMYDPLTETITSVMVDIDCETAGVTCENLNEKAMEKLKALIDEKLDPSDEPELDGDQPSDEQPGDDEKPLGEPKKTCPPK